MLGVGCMSVRQELTIRLGNRPKTSPVPGHGHYTGAHTDPTGYANHIMN